MIFGILLEAHLAQAPALSLPLAMHYQIHSNKLLFLTLIGQALHYRGICQGVVKVAYLLEFPLVEEAVKEKFIP